DSRRRWGASIARARRSRPTRAERPRHVRWLRPFFPRIAHVSARNPSGESMYDLVLKGGNVVDPSSGLNSVADVAVQAGAIARIAPNIGTVEATRTIGVTGKIVTPGPIDVHAPGFSAVTRTGVNPDLAGVYAGVTPVVDPARSGS